MPFEAATVLARQPIPLGRNLIVVATQWSNVNTRFREASNVIANMLRRYPHQILHTKIYLCPLPASTTNDARGGAASFAS